MIELVITSLYLRNLYRGNFYLFLYMKTEEFSVCAYGRVQFSFILFVMVAVVYAVYTRIAMLHN